jgi:hypothetical protein
VEVVAELDRCLLEDGHSETGSNELRNSITERASWKEECIIALEE